MRFSFVLLGVVACGGAPFTAVVDLSAPRDASSETQPSDDDGGQSDAAAVREASIDAPDPTDAPLDTSNFPDVGAVVDACVPATCTSLKIACGDVYAGCGVTVGCGACPENQVCSPAGQCACVPVNHCPGGVVGTSCGTVPDGCGGTYECGACSNSAKPYCNANVCTDTPCTPKSCAAGQCGEVSDGCGGTLTCGNCTSPEACDYSVNVCK